jgi:hypothetical protein
VEEMNATKEMNFSIMDKVSLLRMMILASSVVAVHVFAMCLCVCLLLCAHCTFGVAGY